MATLAEQLAEDYGNLVVAPHYEETDIDRIAELAAARVIRFGGTDSGDDDESVDLGLDYMIYLVQKRFALVSEEVSISDRRRLDEDFRDFREGKAQEASEPLGNDADGEAIE